MTDPGALARQAFDAALRAVAPAAALERALPGVATPGRTHLLSAGKAAVPMMAAASAWLDRAGIRPAQALVVAAGGGCSRFEGIVCVEGDHPRPGTGSAAAAEHIARFAQAAAAQAAAGGDACWVLLSGGFSSLAGAPIHGVSLIGLGDLFDVLLGSGLDIGAMNGIRKRFLRWGAGRLAAALPGLPIRVFAISDVPGDREQDIGSGPCSPDALSLAEVRDLLEASSIRDHIPAEIERSLQLQQRAGLETLKPGDPAFSCVAYTIIASNENAVAAAVARAKALGARRIERCPLTGEAAAAGSDLGRRAAQSAPGTWIVAGGETTVTLPRDASAGGRCQELALAAARELAGTAGVALLAAGTDGRDGATDAAGALVDGTTWEEIRRRGNDPAAALGAHRAHNVLDGAGALIRTGPTGTNVMDIVVAARA